MASHPRPGTHDVYNLEVHLDHVYHVANNGLLVHNGDAEDCEKYYRTMSHADFTTLRLSGRIPATAETMISPTKAYSLAYRGIVVELQVKRGTGAALSQIGVRDSSMLATRAFPAMQTVTSGWTKKKAYFKGEGSQINIGLGRGNALTLFNDNIIGFKAVPR